MKHPLETGHIQRGTAGAAARVAEPVDNTVHTRIHHRAGTHGAGLLRHENRDTVHPPVAYGIRGGGQYQNLGVRRRIFQHFNLMPSRTVFGNVAYPLRGSGLSKRQVAEKVRRLLALVDIADKENAYPSQLSGGQKQRVAIARALANDPKVLLCDEATSALDPQTTNSILRLLKQLNRQLGLTVVVITHEMAVVKEICSRVAVMEHGKVAEEGEVFSIFAAPKQPITQSFIKTTSNLQKIEELIAADSPVTRLNPGELIVRLSYVQRNVSEPLISSITERFHVSVNIIFADIEIVQDAPIGGTVAIMGGEREQLTRAIQYLIEKNVGVEVIRDARAAE